LTDPGVNTYAAIVERGVWRWDFYQCAADDAWLERLLSGMTVTLLIDYQPKAKDAILSYRTNYPSRPCRGWVPSLSQWENADYELGVLYELSENTSDVERSYAAGKKRQIIMRNVED
jgi:hypothetical protein